MHDLPFQTITQVAGLGLTQTFALRLEGLERINALRTHYGLAPLLDPQLDLRPPQFTVQPIKKAAPLGAAKA